MTISEAFANYSLEEIRLKGGAYKTEQNYRTALHCLLKSCTDIPIEFLTYEHVLKWKTFMDYRGLQSSTIATNLQALRQVLKYLIRLHHSVLDPRDITTPKITQQEPDYLEYPEIQAMIDYTSNIRDKALIATLWSSGGRISEVLNINIQAIDKGRVQLLGKGSRLVTLRIDKHAQGYIDDYLNTRHDKIPALFISSQMRRLTVQRAEQIVSQIAGELNFQRPDGREKRVTPHTLRHSFASDLVTNGADIVTTQKLLNHTSPNSTKRYIHISQPREDENYQRFHSL